MEYITALEPIWGWKYYVLHALVKKTVSEKLSIGLGNSTCLLFKHRKVSGIKGFFTGRFYLVLNNISSMSTMFIKIDISVALWQMNLFLILELSLLNTLFHFKFNLFLVCTLTWFQDLMQMLSIKHRSIPWWHTQTCHFINMKNHTHS